MFPGLAWDDVARAHVIGQLPFAGAQDTRGATSSAGDPARSCSGNAAGSKTVWLSYTATFTGTLRVSASGTRYDNSQNYGLVLSAYESGPGAELGCAAGPTAGAVGFANLNLSVTEGSTYLIEVSGAGANNVGGYTVVTASRAD